MQDIEGTAPYRDYQTWYRTLGDLRAGKAPLVLAHGGPGSTHDYLLPIGGLAEQGRAVVFYDQVGNGRSTHLRDAPPEFWTLEFFLSELDNLLGHLGIQDRYHYLGQSWGGVLGAEHAVRRPAGLRSMVIANSPASVPLWVAEANRLRADLPPEVQATLLRHEAAGTTTDPEYVAACRVFYDRHLCRVPWPPELHASFKAIEDDHTVYFAMNGPSEFHCIGTFKDWTIVDRVGQIVAPVLLVSGQYDEATPATVQPFMDGIPDVRWELFEQSSHLPHIEEPERYLEVVGRFLDAHDDRPPSTLRNQA